MANKFTLIIEQDTEGWLVSDVVGLPGCHTQAKSMDVLLRRTKEAIQSYLASDADSEVSGKFVGIQ
ncbi:MAG: type II toxin-antitoxin system HicB family antitoxin [Candidatus Nanohalarchaeota archaeon]|nr:MAG: type II toxin-antitoxin system HicB family antitoxin [Candidatus Nanohaloarchaeota archaeon]